MSSVRLLVEEHASFHVRQATVADVDLIAPLFDAYRQFYGQRPDLATARGFIADRLQRWESVIFCALPANALESGALGFVQLYPSFSSVAARRTWILNDLFVAERARRRGVANELLAAAYRFGRESQAVRIELTTARSNHGAQRLYETAGYRMVNNFISYAIEMREYGMSI